MKLQSCKGFRGLLVPILLTAACGKGPAAEAPAAGGAAAPGGYVALDAVPDAGRVAGKVTITGPIPKLQPRPVTQDHQACGKGEKPNLSLLLSPEGGVANAVVRLVGVSRGKKGGAASPLLDQRECLYEPYLQVAPLGATLTVLNSDPVNHNVHAFGADGATLFNVATPLQGTKVPQLLDRPGPVKLKCDVHPWMFAWVWVAETPYEVATGKDGSFELTDVPPGSYRLAVWHELLKGAEVPVTVPPKGTATASLTVSVAGL